MDCGARSGSVVPIGAEQTDIQAFAHTSQVYVSVGTEPVAFVEDARFWIDWIDKLIANTNDRGRFATPEHRKEVVDLFRRAQ